MEALGDGASQEEEVTKGWVLNFENLAPHPVSLLLVPPRFEVRSPTCTLLPYVVILSPSMMDCVLSICKTKIVTATAAKITLKIPQPTKNNQTPSSLKKLVPDICLEQ